MNESTRCYTAALRILKYRFNSAAELRRKLQANGFEREVIDGTITRLTNEKWLDDERFAEAYVRTQIQRFKGRLRIRRGLMSAGVADEVIKRAVGENVDSESEQAQAVALAQKRLPALVRRYGAVAARIKLTSYLLNQGYDFALVRRIVKETTVAHD